MTIRILKNQTDQDVIINDLGAITVPASGQFNLTSSVDVDFPIQMINASDDLKQAVSDDKLFINDGFEDLSKEESIALLSPQNVLRSVDPYNPSNHTYMIQANMLYSTFINHTEEVFLQNELKNAFVNTFKSVTGVSSFSNLEFDGAGTCLSTTTGSTQIDSFDTVSNWIPDTGVTITSESTIKHEGTGSGKVVISDSIEAMQWAGIDFQPAVQTNNYSTTGNLLLWVYGLGNGEKIRAVVINDDSIAYITNDISF